MPKIQKNEFVNVVERELADKISLHMTEFNELEETVINNQSLIFQFIQI
jgi:hypothetical protein